MVPEKENTHVAKKKGVKVKKEKIFKDEDMSLEHSNITKLDLNVVYNKNRPPVHSIKPEVKKKFTLKN